VPKPQTWISGQTTIIHRRWLIWFQACKRSSTERSAEAHLSFLWICAIRRPYMGTWRGDNLVYHAHYFFCHSPLGCSMENCSSIETAYHPTSGQTTSLTGGCNPRNTIGQQGIMVPNMVEHRNQNRKMQSLTRWSLRFSYALGSWIFPRVPRRSDQ
jgi:hypothetical protein